MEQDLREVFKKQREKEKFKLKKGHEERFLNLLEKELPQRKKTYSYMLKIAAAILVMVSIGFGYHYLSNTEPSVNTVVESKVEENKRQDFSFGDLSPDLKKVERYYLANINMELSKLEVSPETKGLVDSFLEQLNHLNGEYKNLNEELQELGPNDQTINALIENLQLRLQLLQKLKKKLNELKTSKNEQIKENSI